MYYGKGLIEFHDINLGIYHYETCSFENVNFEVPKNIGSTPNEDSLRGRLLQYTLKM
jgi:hypothetical protein